MQLTSRTAVSGRAGPAQRQKVVIALRPASLLRRSVLLRTAASESVDVSLSGSSISSVVSTDEDTATGKTPWYKKPCVWEDVSSLEELQHVISPEGNNGKMTVIDLYAGWCSSCKAAFPALCRVPAKSGVAEHFNFYKANVEQPEVQAYIKKMGVCGIPHVLVFDATGKKLLGMGASFKKMEAMRKNLAYIANAEVKDFVLDPNGFVIQR